MVDPATMFMEGGPFMYVLLLMVPVHLLLCLVQAALARHIDIRPLLWGSVAAQVLTGFLGSLLGMILAFQAVAHASAEMKQTLLANGISVSMFTATGGVMLAIPSLFFAAAAASVVATLKRRDEAAMVEKLEALSSR